MSRTAGSVPVAGWGLMSRVFHWLSALLVLMQIGAGLAMAYLSLGLDLRFALFQWHKSLGFLLLLVTLLRLCWRLMTRTPPTLPGLSPAMMRAASLMHGLLYGLIFGLVMAGWVMVSASPLRLPTVLFGLVTVPPLVAPNLEIYQAARLAHAVMGWLLSLSVLLHVLAAFWHHLVRRDDLLVRMWRGGLEPDSHR